MLRISVAGLNYVVRQAAQSGRPTIASMSLGGGASRALDNAVVAVSSPGLLVKLGSSALTLLSLLEPVSMSPLLLATKA